MATRVSTPVEPDQTFFHYESGSSERTASNSYYRGPIGNGAFGEPVPASDREEGTRSVSGHSGGGSNAVDHGYTGNGAFGEAP